MQKVYGHFAPICGDIKYFRFQSRLLQERGADIWQALPTDCFEHAIDVAIERQATLNTREGGAFKLAVLLPGLAKHKPGLLGGLQDTIDTYYNGTFQQPLLLALLADYASRDIPEYVAGIDHALQAAGNLIKDPQEFVGWVLQHATQFAPAKALSEVAVRLVNHSSNTTVSGETIAALHSLMERPEADLKLFEIIWPSVQQLLDRMSGLPPVRSSSRDATYLNQFVDALAPHLNGEWVGKLFLALCTQPDTPATQGAIARVRDRWLQLCDESPKEALTAWHLAMHDLSRKPRTQFLDKAEWLIKVVAKLGGNQAVVSIGDGIVEVSSWKWIAVKVQSGDASAIFAGQDGR